MIRCIEWYTLGDAKIDGVDWEAIDRSVGEKASRLEKLVVYSSEESNRRMLPGRLPKLSARGEFGVEDHEARPGECLLSMVFLANIVGDKARW